MCCLRAGIRFEIIHDALFQKPYKLNVKHSVKTKRAKRPKTKTTNLCVFAWEARTLPGVAVALGRHCTVVAPVYPFQNVFEPKVANHNDTKLRSTP